MNVTEYLQAYVIEIWFSSAYYLIFSLMQNCSLEPNMATLGL